MNVRKKQPTQKKIKQIVFLEKNEFFFYLVFFHEYSRFTGQQGKVEAISLTPNLFPLHRHLYISRVITAENLPLHITSSRNQTGNDGFWVQVANH